MRLNSQWLAVPIIACLAVIAVRADQHYENNRGRERFIDDAGMITPGFGQRINRYLDDVMDESGVDFRVRTVNGTRGQSLPAFTLDVMRKEGIGKEVGGRGLLLVINASTRQARIEVGPHLEGVLPDGLIGFLLRNDLGAISTGTVRARHGVSGQRCSSFTTGSAPRDSARSSTRECSTTSRTCGAWRVAAERPCRFAPFQA